MVVVYCLAWLFLIQSKTYDSVTDKFMDFSFEKVIIKEFRSVDADSGLRANIANLLK